MSSTQENTVVKLHNSMDNIMPRLMVDEQQDEHFVLRKVPRNATMNVHLLNMTKRRMHEEHLQLLLTLTIVMIELRCKARYMNCMVITIIKTFTVDQKQKNY